MFKVIISGGRNFQDYETLRDHCDKVLARLHPDIEVVSGRCSTGKYTFTNADGVRVFGADGLGERYAEEKGYPVKPFPADWDTYGRAAGPRRNHEMARYVYPDGGCISFWDGRSPGTKGMIDLAKKYELKLEIKYEKPS